MRIKVARRRAAKGRRPRMPIDQCSRFQMMLVAIRSERRMSQAEMADALGVTQKTLSFWESGRVVPSRLRQYQFCQWAFEEGLIDRSPDPRWVEHGGKGIA